MAGELKTDVARAFSAVDATAVPSACVDYLDGVTSLPAVRTHKRRSWDMLALDTAARVLDVGCGMGDDARALAAIVGPRGRVLGVDSSEVMVSQARARCDLQPENVRFLVCDAHRLRLPDASFDAARADRVFQHLDDPAAALREMRRVVRRGGRVVVSEPDWDTLLVDADDLATERAVRTFYADCVRNGTIGRRLPRLFAECGLTIRERIAETLCFTSYEEGEAVLGVAAAGLRARDAGVITMQAADRWIEGIQSLRRRGAYLCAVMGMAVCGVRDD